MAFNTLIISSAVSAASAPFVASFGASTFDRLFNAFSGQNPKSNRNFAVLGNMRQAVACTHQRHIQNGQCHHE